MLLLCLNIILLLHNTRVERQLCFVDNIYQQFYANYHVCIIIVVRSFIPLYADSHLLLHQIHTSSRFSWYSWRCMFSKFHTEHHLKPLLLISELYHLSIHLFNTDINSGSIYTSAPTSAMCLCFLRLQLSPIFIEPQVSNTFRSTARQQH